MFYAFLLQKNYLWSETGTGGGLIDPVGAKDVKRTGVENFAGGSNPPPSARTLEWMNDIHSWMNVFSLSVSSYAV